MPRPSVPLSAVVPGANHVDPADGPFPQLLNGLAGSRRASPLGSHLDRPVVLARGGDHELSLPGRVAARFLHIGVLAGGTGQDGGRGVPVVGPGVEQSVHLGIIQDPPKVSYLLRRLSRLLLDRVGHLGQTPRVDVADVLDVDVGLLAEALGQSPASAHSHDPDDHPGVGRIVFDVAPGGDRKSGCGYPDGGAAQKTSPVDGFRHGGSSLRITVIRHYRRRGVMLSSCALE